MNKIFALLFLFWAIVMACTSRDDNNDGGKDESTTASSDNADPRDLDRLSRSLTFHSSFDKGPDADFSLGDPRIYSGKTVGGQQKPVSSEPGLGSPPLALVPGGRFGNALEFTRENSHLVFYKAENNVRYSPTDFSGTVSFWLRLDPQKIPQTYTDPIQLTDKDYSSSAIWVDFTKNDTPSDFRLGIYGDQKVWDQKNLKGASEEFFWRILKIVKPPFSQDKWTHVVISWEGINTNAIARGKLYLDGVLQGETGGITEPFVWDLPETTIRLGLGPFVGMFDDVAIFNRSLTDQEVQVLYQLENGVAELSGREGDR